MVARTSLGPMSSVENKARIKANTVKLKNNKLHREDGNEIRPLYSMGEESLFQEFKILGHKFWKKRKTNGFN